VRIDCKASGNIIEIYILTSDRSHLTFCTIGNEAGDISNFFQGGGQGVNIILVGGEENGDIVGIEGNANGGCSSLESMKMALIGGFAKDVVERANGQNE
jgi:hypothetical protein